MRRLPLLVSLLFWLLGLVYRRIDGFKPTNELRRRFIRCFELNTYARMMAVLGQERGQKGGRGRAGVKHIDRYAYLPSIYQLCSDRLECGERGDTQRSLRSLVSHLYMYVVAVLTFNEFDNIGVRIQLMSGRKKRLCEIIVLDESSEKDLLYEPIYLLRHASIASNS